MQAHQSNSNKFFINKLKFRSYKLKMTEQSGSQNPKLIKESNVKQESNKVLSQLFPCQMCQRSLTLQQISKHMEMHYQSERKKQKKLKRREARKRKTIRENKVRQQFFLNRCSRNQSDHKMLKKRMTKKQNSNQQTQQNKVIQPKQKKITKQKPKKRSKQLKRLGLEPECRPDSSIRKYRTTKKNYKYNNKFKENEQQQRIQQQNQNCQNSQQQNEDLNIQNQDQDQNQNSYQNQNQNYNLNQSQKQNSPIKNEIIHNQNNLSHQNSVKKHHGNSNDRLKKQNHHIQQIYHQDRENIRYNLQRNQLSKLQALLDQQRQKYENQINQLKFKLQVSYLKSKYDQQTIKKRDQQIQNLKNNIKKQDQQLNDLRVKIEPSPYKFGRYEATTFKNPINLQEST